MTSGWSKVIFRGIFTVMNFRPALLVVLLASCASLPDPQTQEWDQNTFQRALDRDDVVLVDLRTPAEVASGRLPGAVLVDYWSDFGRFLTVADKSRTYLVYCAHGVRGREAVERMRRAGFVEVHNLAGGLAGWKESP